MAFHRGKWASRAKMGFPCKSCQNGNGYVGALCNCLEWGVHQSNQIFKPPFRNHFNTKPLAPVDTAGLNAKKAKCLAAIKATPAGAAAWKQRDLRSMMNGEADNCALDSSAGLKGASPHFNRRHAIQSFCEVCRHAATDGPCTHAAAHMRGAAEDRKIPCADRAIYTSKMVAADDKKKCAADGEIRDDARAEQCSSL